MRIVSWNVRSLRDDPRGVAEVLRRLAPDVVCVQEAPRLGLWRLSRRRLARRAGLRVVTAGRSAGVVLLARPDLPVVRASTRLLPKRPGLHRRAVAVAVLLLDGREVAVAATHLDLDPEARLDSARRVRAAMPAVPVVLGADVNDEPGSATWQVLSQGLDDAGGAPTFPAREPHRRIDVLLVDPALSVLAMSVESAGAVSDHLPVVAELAWRNRA